MKCKDYFIFKTRCHADKKLLDEWYNGGTQPQQQWDRAQNHVSFWWDFIQEVTGKKMEFWLDKYAIDSKECAMDFIEENFGIIYIIIEGTDRLFIPKSNKILFEWCKDNCKNPWKVLQKTTLGVFNYPRDLQWKRENSEEFTKNNPILKKLRREKKLKKIIDK